MRPFRGSDKAAPGRRRSARASERLRLPQGNGLGSLQAPAGGLRPQKERPRGALSLEREGVSGVECEPEAAALPGKAWPPFRRVAREGREESRGMEPHGIGPGRVKWRQRDTRLVQGQLRKRKRDVRDRVMTSQEIGRLAGRIFTNVLPEYLVARSQQDQEDYGIDYEIEVMLPGDRAGGVIFKVQEKGTTDLGLNAAGSQISYSDLTNAR